MEILDSTKIPLKEIWQDEKKRAAAKHCIAFAVSQCGEDMPIRAVYNIGRELDELLLDKDDQDEKSKNPMV